MSLEIHENKILFNKKNIGYIFEKNTSFNDIGKDFYKESACSKYAQANIRSSVFFEYLQEKDFIEDLYISFIDNESFNFTSYDFWKKGDILRISIPFVISIHEWSEFFPLKTFLEEFSVFFKKDYSNCFFASDEYLFITYLVSDIQKNENIKDVINRLTDLYFEKYDEFLNRNKIQNSIIFSPEHLTAGSSILQYFGKLLQEKYPTEKVSVSIKQEGLKVTMLIETPDGKKEEIQDYLDSYGLVVTNQISPEEFTKDSIQLLELKQELREAKNKILFQQELLSLKDESYKKRIISLEEEVEFLRKEFSNILLNNKEEIKMLLSSVISKDKLIERLSNSIEKRNKKETKFLLAELKKDNEKEYVSLKEHIDNFVVGSAINLPSWIDFLIKIL